MNLDNSVKELLVEQACNIFGSFYLENKFAGFNRVLEDLIGEGNILMADDPELTEHFLSFPYFSIQPSKEAISCVNVSFNADSFLKSADFQSYIEEKMNHLLHTISESEVKLQQLNRFQSVMKGEI